jgi:hypothetical protein
MPTTHRLSFPTCCSTPGVYTFTLTQSIGCFTSLALGLNNRPDQEFSELCSWCWTLSGRKPLPNNSLTWRELLTGLTTCLFYHGPDNPLLQHTPRLSSNQVRTTTLLRCQVPQKTQNGSWISGLRCVCEYCKGRIQRPRDSREYTGRLHGSGFQKCMRVYRGHSRRLYPIHRGWKMVSEPPTQLTLHFNCMRPGRHLSSWSCMRFLLHMLPFPRLRIKTLNTHMSTLAFRN